MNQTIRKTKALVVVAHPDDHFIWMGGAIFMLRDIWEWHVLYLCDYSDSGRRKRSEESFKNSSKDLGIKVYEPSKSQIGPRYIVNYGDIRDIRPYQMINMFLEFRRFWDKNTNQGKEKYDIIFTHSLNPHHEYGFHPNHAEVREVLYRCLGKMNSKYYRPVIAHFCYNPRTAGKEVDEKEATHTVSLDKNSRELKKRENFLKIFPWAERDMGAFKIPEEREGFKILFLDSYLANGREDFSLPSIFQENE